MADTHGYIWGTGRRKTAVARVRIRPGEGKVLINGRDADEYFTTPRLRDQAVAPLRSVKDDATYDVWANIRGGGINGQAGALMMGLGRALAEAHPDKHHDLRVEGFLSRDSRMVERKKPGRPGARKSFQFSKR